MRVIWRSFWGFLRAALAPIRDFNNVVQELGITVAGVVAIRFAADEWGGTWAALIVVSVFAALLLLEGYRREYRQNVVKLVFHSQGPELLNVRSNLNRTWKLVIRVENEGATGRFTATCIETTGTIEGTSEFDLPWDGQFSAEQRIRRGRHGYIDLAYLDPHRRRVRFALTPSTYSGPEHHGLSPEKTPTGLTIDLLVEVADVDRDVARTASATIQFDPHGGQPTLTVN